MRVFIWHGYLLRGTGSNEYTRALARTLAKQGHEVVVFCQEPQPAALDLGGAKVIRPAVPGQLPVFVLDRYPDLRAALLPDMAKADVEAFVAAQAAAIRHQGHADLLIVNHVLLGGPVGAASGLPYVVKAHGSELEYAMRGNPALCGWAAESLAGAGGVVVGSAHIARVVHELVGLPHGSMAIVPPGVDTHEMVPQTRDQALADLLAQAALDGPNGGNERLPDDGNFDRFKQFLADPDTPTVLYVGKLSREKGVHLLLEAMAGVPARLVVVGFGPARADLAHQAAELGLTVLFTGPLAHRHLRHLWALADLSVVPSVFPEAFGMVAAEAAATGCPPLVANHSGLAEVAAGIEEYLPGWLRVLSFTPGDAADLRRRVREVLALGTLDRAVVASGCRAAVEQLWSWDSVATRMLHVAGPDPLNTPL